jgi:hypothetical protein
MKLALAFVLALAALIATVETPLAQINNTCTTVVLHAVPGNTFDCVTSLNCTTVQPTTRIDAPSGLYKFNMYLKNYELVNGVQVAFDWPVNWFLSFGLWQCQVGQVVATTPSAPGPLTGSITTAFNSITGGALAPIGFMVFNGLTPGCLSIIESGYPFGNHVIDNKQGKTHLDDVNEGRICVGADGYNTCDCRSATPAEAATWGQIKATYDR